MQTWGQQLLNLITTDTGIPPGARIPVDIGGHTYGWHVEDRQANNFNTHFDYGDPNWSVMGIFEHIFRDGLEGQLLFSNSAALDPKCAP